MAGRTLTIYLAADTKRAQQELSGFGKTLNNIGKVAAVAAAAGLAIAVDKMVEIGKESIDLASSFNEASSKAQVLFGKKTAKDIKAWAETASTAFGQSKLQATEAASTFAVFGKSAGLQGPELAGFSKQLTTLASDMASFSNTDVDTAINAIGAALRGEAEPIRAFGVLLNDATLKAEAMKLGVYDGEGALTSQQKVLAAQAAILKQTSDAQGDFARTSDGLANSTRIATAKFDDLKIKIGQALLPVVNSFMQDALLPLIDVFTRIWDKSAPKVEAALQRISDWFKKDGQDAVKAFSDFMETDGAKMFERWIADLVEVGQDIGFIVTKVRELIDWLGSLDKTTSDNKFLSALIASVKQAIYPLQTLLDIIRGIRAQLEQLGVIDGPGWFGNSSNSDFSNGGGGGGSTGSSNSRNPASENSQVRRAAATDKGSPQIVIQAGIGDPVAIAREVERVLRLSETRLGPS